MTVLAKREICTGCTACASVCPSGCITMTADENGFLYPEIDMLNCVNCGLCEKTCPILHPLATTMNYHKAYAAYSKDEEMRMESSSGGVFTEFAKVVLEHGGSVFGAAYTEQFEVVHICVEQCEEISRLRGAKYAQSDLRGVFAEVKARLDMGRKVLFSGTPCQVGGLKAYLRKDYENLMTVDFVCHSVPSPMAWREYVKYRALQDNNGILPKTINLRDKETGWSRYQYSNMFEYEEGQIHADLSGKSLYMKLFTGGYISRKACENCQYKGYRRVSDLTIGDFWGIWDIKPEFDDNKGTSVILVQSERGSELLQSSSQKIVLGSVTLEEASRQNGAMLKAAQSNELRSKALEWIRLGEISRCESWFEAPKNTASQIIRRGIGWILRGWKK